MPVFVKFSTILLAFVILTGCQLPGIQAGNSSATEPPDAEGPDLTLLVSEEIVIGAAMPVSEDGQDDLIERVTDPLPLEPEGPKPATDIWERIRRGFALEHHVDEKRVAAELNWYKRHPEYLNRVATEPPDICITSLSKSKPAIYLWNLPYCPLSRVHLIHLLTLMAGRPACGNSFLLPDAFTA